MTGRAISLLLLLLLPGLVTGTARAQAATDSGLVEVQSIDKSIRVSKPPALARPGVASALGRVARRLATGGVGIEVMMGQGRLPGHGDGRALDLRLVDLSRGTPLPMGSDYRRDDGADSVTASGREARYRGLLAKVMTEEGFVGDSARWWHYELGR